MEKLVWKTEKRKIDDLLAYEGNPRKMSVKQVKDLKRSIEKFDLVEIPAINTDNKIVAGHQRLKVMQMVGRGKELVDVRVPNRPLTEEEFREYLLRSNKNSGDWDFEVLADFEEEVLLEAGFETQEIKNIFGLEDEAQVSDKNAPASITISFKKEDKENILKLLRETLKDFEFVLISGKKVKE